MSFPWKQFVSWLSRISFNRSGTMNGNMSCWLSASAAQCGWSTSETYWWRHSSSALCTAASCSSVVGPRSLNELVPNVDKQHGTIALDLAHSKMVPSFLSYSKLKIIMIISVSLQALEKEKEWETSVMCCRFYTNIVFRIHRTFQHNVRHDWYK